MVAPNSSQAAVTTPSDIELKRQQEIPSLEALTSTTPGKTGLTISQASASELISVGQQAPMEASP